MYTRRSHDDGDDDSVHDSPQQLHARLASFRVENSTSLDSLGLYTGLLSQLQGSVEIFYKQERVVEIPLPPPRIPEFRQLPPLIAALHAFVVAKSDKIAIDCALSASTPERNVQAFRSSNDSDDSGDFTVSFEDKQEGTTFYLTSGPWTGAGVASAHLARRQNTDDSREVISVWNTEATFLKVVEVWRPPSICRFAWLLTVPLAMVLPEAVARVI